jgi:hypothetical protein
MSTPTPTPTSTPTPTPTRTATPTPTPTPLPPELVCASASLFDVNVATLKNLPSDWSAGHEISVEFKLVPGGQQIAGLVLNYLPAGTYVAVIVDINNGALKIIRYNGTSFVTEFAIAFADFSFVFDTNRWHKIAVTPSVNTTNNTVTLAGKLTDVAGTKILSFSTSLANYGMLAGSAGLFADRTYAHFNKLRIEQ